MSRPFIYIIVLFSAFTFGCNPAMLTMKKADKKFRYGEYQESIRLYHKAINHDFKVPEANYKIAESYRLSNRIAESSDYYKEAITAGYDREEEIYLRYSQSMKSNEKYEEARQVLEDYIEKGTDKQSVELAKTELDNLIKLQELMKRPSYINIKNLEDINTPFAEYSPYYFDGELYFTSNRYGGKIYKATGTSFTNIYKVKTKGAIVDTTTIKALDDLVNSENAHEGCITISPDGSMMVFAKGNTSKKKSSDDVELYKSTLRRGEWSQPEKMRINDPRAWDSTPMFSPDGTKLYFASNRTRGGKGGTDIWVATKSRRGNRFTKPVNAGDKINTPFNEMFPFPGQDGNLYFSSDGHPGFGELDIFVAKRSQGKFVVENLGLPINSNKDDFGIYLYTVTKGFFTSNREGGKGDDDIYTFVNNDPDLKIVNYFLEGLTVTLDDDNKEIPLPNTSVKLYSKEDNEVVAEALTNKNGEFRLRVYEEEDYYLLAERPQYLISRGNFSTKGKSVPKEELTKLVTNKVFETKLRLDRIILEKSIVLDNIYYDLDKWDIRADAAAELDKLVVILQDNPQIKIELSSHTDSRAPADYNLDLSKKRAQSAVNYIISQGIAADRLVAKGYGESQLIVSDDEIAAMSTEEEKEKAHQRNRRTEFKVTEYNPVVEKEEDDEEVTEEELVLKESVEPKTEDDDLENRIDWDN